jgi:hypothetical protein
MRRAGRVLCLEDGFVISLFAFALFCAASFADDETDFSVTPPGSWLRSNPVGIGVYSFTGGVARLSGPAPSTFFYNISGPARLALFGPTTFSQTVISADLVAWGATRNIPGVIARATNIGLGTTCGYSFGVIPSTGEVAVHRVTGELPTPISAVTFITLTPGHSYRIMLICTGSIITGRIFDVANLAYPIIELSAVDSTYTSGLAGILNSTDGQVAIDVSFDHFLAWDGTPAPLTITPGDGTMTVSGSLAKSLSTNLETTDDLATPFQLVFPPTTVNGGFLENILPVESAQRYYRRKLVGAQ